MDNSAAALSLAYLRKSRAERNDPDALHRHREAISRAARLAGHDLRSENIYEELGSGEYLHTRPVFQRLLGRLQTRPGWNLWVMDVDRLARGEQTERAFVGKIITDAAALIWLPAGGVIDLRDPDQRLLFQVKGDLAENELGKYKQRVKQARDSMRREGIPRTGNVPEIGYDWDKAAKAVVITESFPLLQSLLTDAFSLSLGALVRQYGLPINLIRNALTNPFVCGYPVQRSTAGGVRLPRAQWVWPEQPGAYPVAISREDWERLQEVIQQRRLPRDTYRSAKGWCRDVLRFVGGPPVPARLGNHNYPGHAEDTYWIIPPGERRRLFVPRPLVHARAETALRELLRPVEALRAIAAARQSRPQKRSSSEVVAAAQALLSLRADLTALERRELRATDAEDLLAIASLRQEIKAEIASWQRELQQVQTAGSAPDLLPLLGKLTALRDNWDSGWPALPDHVKRAVVNAFLQRILVEVEAVQGQRRHERRVVAVEYHEWVSACLLLPPWGRRKQKT